VLSRIDIIGHDPKMIAKETDARMIGYGSMLMEGVVGVVALIAATSLFPAITSPSTRRSGPTHKSDVRANGR